MKINGSIVSLITPFANDKLDLNGFDQLIQWHHDKSDGLVISGSTGEGALLSLEEKEILWSRAKKSTTIPIVAGCFGLDYLTTVEQIRIALRTQCDAILIAPPPYLKPTQNAIVCFYETIAEYTTDECPIILYNNPSRCGVDIAVETVLTLAQHPKIMGIKDSSNDITRPQRIRMQRPFFGIFAGDDPLIGPFLSHGANGWINVVGNIAPSLCQKMMRHWGHHQKEFESIYQNIYPIMMKMIESGPNPLPIKFFTHQIHDYIKNEVRFPLLPIQCPALSDEERRIIS
jgi:4-hydroxy-tetrahydrodipicolinate synthase